MSFTTFGLQGDIIFVYSDGTKVNKLIQKIQSIVVAAWLCLYSLLGTKGKISMQSTYASSRTPLQNIVPLPFTPVSHRTLSITEQKRSQGNRMTCLSALHCFKSFVEVSSQIEGDDENSVWCCSTSFCVVKSVLKEYGAHSQLKNGWIKSTQCEYDRLQIYGV